MRFVTCGDAAFTLELAAAPDAASARRIAQLHEVLTSAAPRGYRESIPGLTTLTILFDPDAISAVELRRELEPLLEREASAHSPPREWRLPVCYGGEFGPDLADVAAACGLAADDVVQAHVQRTYVVYVIGFSPGFPYLGDIDPRLVLPRRAEPRSRVAAGSVAIATDYTAIYPQATAGGWHLLGRTPVKLFDQTWEQPALLRAGDMVRFYAIDRAAYENMVAGASIECLRIR